MVIPQCCAFRFAKVRTAKHILRDLSLLTMGISLFVKRFIYTSHISLISPKRYSSRQERYQMYLSWTLRTLPRCIVNFILRSFRVVVITLVSPIRNDHSPRYKFVTRFGPLGAMSNSYSSLALPFTSVGRRRPVWNGVPYTSFCLCTSTLYFKKIH